MAAVDTPSIRFGIAGMGVGRGRAERAAHTAGARLSAIFDHRPDNARALADGWGCEAATSFDDLIHRDDVDVVGIFTPSGTHGDLAMQAMRAGKHAIVTKPPDVSVAKVDAMIRVAKETGKLLAVDFDMRYRDSVRKMKAAVDAGKLGQPIFGDMRLKWWRPQSYFDGGMPEGWRGTWAMDGGGSLANQGVHDLDILQWCMGPVRSVRARTRIFAHRIETEDACQVFVEFASGAWGLIETTTTVWGGLGRAIELHGSGGVIAMKDGELTAWRFTDDTPATNAETARSPWEPILPERQPKNIIEDVVAALTLGTPVACPPEEGRKSVAILEAVYRSASRGGAEEPVAP